MFSFIIKILYNKKVEMDIIKLKNGDVKVLEIRDGTSLDNLENRPISTQSKVNRLHNYNQLTGKLDSKLEYTLLNTEMKIINDEIVCDPK